MSSSRPRRSCLYMPGANAKAMDKARALPADALIFDLEDAVAPEAKEEARAAIAATMAQGGYGKRELVIRVNALSTPWGRDDVLAAAKAGPDGVLFPKIDGSGEIEAAEALLREAGAPAHTKIWAMIETPKAILDIREIARAAERTRLSVFVMGTNDLAKDLHATQTAGREPFLAALSLSVIAARAYGVTPIDGVFNDIQDAAGFEAVCRHGLSLGFDGKTLIHPSQIDTCNAVFAPTPEEIHWARGVIAAFADPANAGKGVLKVDGKMTELLHLAQAERTVAIADAITALAQA